MSPWAFWLARMTVGFPLYSVFGNVCPLSGAAEQPAEQRTLWTLRTLGFPKVFLRHFS